MRKDSQISLRADAIVRIMERRHGLDISGYAGSFLEQTLAQRMAETGGLTVEAYDEGLAGSRAEAEAFYRSLHVGYSEFFRNPLTFALLEQQVLPALIAAKRQTGGSELRVWSAGCAAGQEAWSVAILLDELCGACGAAPLAHRIFATDISEPELNQARTGVYSAAAVGNIRMRQLQNCFSRQGEAYTIVPRLRARVAFSTYDLLDARTASPADSLYGDFDLILCCNLLFYYRPDRCQRILDKVCRALAPGGYFVTSETERAVLAEHGGLRAVVPVAAVFRKKAEGC